MNPNDRAWYDRLGIDLTRTEATRYVYAIEPAQEDAQDAQDAQEVEA